MLALLKVYSYSVSFWFHQLNILASLHGIQSLVRALLRKTMVYYNVCNFIFAALTIGAVMIIWYSPWTYGQQTPRLFRCIWKRKRRGTVKLQPKKVVVISLCNIQPDFLVHLWPTTLGIVVHTHSYPVQKGNLSHIMDAFTFIFIQK